MQKQKKHRVKKTQIIKNSKTKFKSMKMCMLMEMI